MNRETIINNIKAVGQSIIDNAESIVGNEKYMSDIYITISHDWNEVPDINISRTFTPEQIVERKE